MPKAMDKAPEAVHFDCQRPSAPSLSTKDLGWPNSDLEIYKVSDEWYFNTAAVLEEFGIKKRVDHKGYKITVDKILFDQGKLPF